MNQQLTRLHRELESVTDQSHWMELSARIAIVLARLGRFEEARFQIKEIRSVSAGEAIGAFHVWVMLAEAVTDWFETLSPIALDRVTRVQALAGAMRYAKVHAISSAWKAHIQFETSDFDGMLRSLELAGRAMQSQVGEAGTRTAIVISNSFSLCGDVEGEQHWFRKGRDFALSDGDFLSIEALQYNRAVLAFACLRANSCLQEIDESSMHRVRREIETTKNLQLLTDNTTLINHLQLVDARMNLLEGNYHAAIEQLQVVAGKSPFAKYHFSDDSIAVELAYCYQEIGDIERARAILHGVDIRGFASLDIDDHLVAVHLYREVSVSFGLGSCSKAVEVLLRELGLAYVKTRKDLSLGLKRLPIVGNAQSQ